MANGTQDVDQDRKYYYCAVACVQRLIQNIWEVFSVMLFCFMLSLLSYTLFFYTSFWSLSSPEYFLRGPTTFSKRTIYLFVFNKRHSVDTQ
jgi:hypothetical protein